jgi:hypothetical protein
MEKRQLTKVLLLLAMLFLLVGLSPALAAPVQQSGNLLANGSFEQPFVNGAAEGWSKWSLQTEKEDDACLSGYHYLPKWNMETGGSLVADGVTSQYIGNNWDTWSAGVLQTVDVTPGVTYRFSFSARGRAANERSPEPSDSGVNMNVKAGIDPNGSGQWNDADVVWSASGSPHDAWQTFTVEATATGAKMTVFTSADFGVPGVNQCRQFMDTWYDKAELVAAGPPPTNTAPPAAQATQPPAATPTALPEPSPELVPTAEAAPTEGEQPPAEPSPEPSPVSGGTICVNAFHDENGNGLQDPNEGYMAGVTVIVAGESAVVGQAISTGMETPTCFQGLAPGSYQVAQQVPGRLQMTTAANAVVNASDGKTVMLAFGSKLRQSDGLSGAGSAPDAGATTASPGGETDESAPATGFDPLALSGLGVILIGLLLLGVLLFFFLRR